MEWLIFVISVMACGGKSKKVYTFANHPPKDSSLFLNTNDISSKPGNLLELDPYQWSTSETKQGGTLYMPLSTPRSLNFLIENSTAVSTIQSYVSIGLIERHHDDLVKYGPALATYYGRSADHKTYTFHLRDDVLWHEPAVDNVDGSYNWLLKGKSCRKGHFIKGRCRVTAHDVVFMMDIMKNEQVLMAAPLRAYFKDLESYRAVDDFTLELTFDKKSYNNEMISKWVFPMPEFLYAYEQDGKRFTDEMIGTSYQEHWFNPNGLGNGPYRLESFQKGESIVLKKDPLFPLGNNNFDQIVLRLDILDYQRVQMLQNNDLHISVLSKKQYKKHYLEAEETSPFKNGDILNGSFFGWGYSYIGWNLESPLFSSKLVRQAMSHACNAEKILRDVNLGLGKRTTGPLSPNLPYYDDSLPLIPFDLERAAALLEQAGWNDSDGDGILDKDNDGTRMDFDFGLVILGSSAATIEMAEIYKRDLSKIGVKMKLVTVDWAGIQKMIGLKNFQAIHLGWGTTPDVNFHQIWHSSQANIPSGSNYIGFRNAEADEIIEAMEQEFDIKKRIELSKKFHRLIYDEQPYTFLFQNKSTYFYVNELQNVSTSKVRPYFDPRPWYLFGEESK